MNLNSTEPVLTVRYSRRSCRSGQDSRSSWPWWWGQYTLGHSWPVCPCCFPPKSRFFINRSSSPQFFGPASLLFFYSVFLNFYSPSFLFVIYYGFQHIFFWVWHRRRSVHVGVQLLWSAGHRQRQHQYWHPTPTPIYLVPQYLSRLRFSLLKKMGLLRYQERMAQL